MSWVRRGVRSREGVSRGGPRLRTGLALAGTGAGVLGGLVAVTASAGAAVPVSAAALGSVSGGTVTVAGLAFPDPSRADLSFVGCADLYRRGAESLQPMVGRGPGSAPLGNRSMAFDLTGGDAVGAMFAVDSVRDTTVASLSVHADGGSSSGVAYVGFQSPDDAGTRLMWLGRASLATPGEAWHAVDATGRAYTWTQYDMDTHAVVAQAADGAQTIADFTAGHGGDGPGFFTVGFGCDGTPFNMDDFTVGTAAGTTTYDLEGLTTSVAMRHSLAADDRVVLRGALSTDTGNAVPEATLLLEHSDSADGPWQPADVVPVRNGVAATTVSPAADKTYYRWRFVDRPLASGSVSPVTVVAGTGPDPTASPTPDPTPTPTSGPTTGPTSGPTSGPTTSPTAEPTADPTADPTTGPTAGPTQSVTAGPTTGSSGGASTGPSPTAEPSTTAPVSPSRSSSATASTEPTRAVEPSGSAAGAAAGQG